MDDAVVIGIHQTPADMLGRLLDDNVDALDGHRHGDPGAIRVNPDSDSLASKPTSRTS